MLFFSLALVFRSCAESLSGVESDLIGSSVFAVVELEMGMGVWERSFLVGSDAINLEFFDSVKLCFGDGVDEINVF